MLTLLSKGVPTKFEQFFWLKIFFICHRCQRHRWSTLSCEYLREFSKKFETVLMGYSGAGGKLIHEKNQEQKISWHCPFKGIIRRDLYYWLFVTLIIHKLRCIIVSFFTLELVILRNLRFKNWWWATLILESLFQYDLISSHKIQYYTVLDPGNPSYRTKLLTIYPL
jgi:hypothetical protein